MMQAQTMGTRLSAAVIRAARATSTHRAIVVDALDRLDGPQAPAWRRLFLRHADVLCLGADAPDAEFRDFKNHFLFPAAGFACGATGKAQSWYRNLVAALSRREWRNAAYCAGVLSHYVVDAVHPLHTAQSTVDNDVSTALDATTEILYRSLLARKGNEVGMLGLIAGPHLATYMMEGASAARASYAPLLTHFCLERAGARLSTGLDQCGLDQMAMAIDRAIAMVAAVLQAALAESAASAPRVHLARTTLRATFAASLSAYQANARRRRSQALVRAIAEEKRNDGQVSRLLSEAVRAKRRCFETAIAQSQPVARDATIVTLAARRTRRQSLPATATTADIVSIARSEVNVRRSVRPLA